MRSLRLSRVGRVRAQADGRQHYRGHEERGCQGAYSGRVVGCRRHARKADYRRGEGLHRHRTRRGRPRRPQFETRRGSPVGIGGGLALRSEEDRIDHDGPPKEHRGGEVYSERVFGMFAACNKACYCHDRVEGGEGDR